jgi:hypothetical protein
VISYVLHSVNMWWSALALAHDDALIYYKLSKVPMVDDVNVTVGAGGAPLSVAATPCLSCDG